VKLPDARPDPAWILNFESLWSMPSVKPLLPDTSPEQDVKRLPTL
jgi:hypothetical protein